MLVDYPGIGRSSGQTPSKVAALTNACVAFCRAIGLTRFDVAGFSLGGVIAQQIGAEYPDTIRRMILLGSARHGGEGLVFDDLSVDELNDPAALVMKAFFTPSETSQASGHAYLERLKSRVDDRDIIWRQAIWRADRSVASLHVLPRGFTRQAACRCGLEGALRGDQRKATRQETRSQGPQPMDLGRLGGDRPVFHEGDQSRQPDALRNRAADEEPPVQHDGLASDRAVRGRRLDGHQRQDHGELAGLPDGA